MKQQDVSPMLVLAGPNVDRSALPEQAVWLDDFAMLHETNKSASTIVDALKSVVSRAANAPILVAPWDLLFGGILDFFANTNPNSRHFKYVVILDANAFPALGLHRCFAFAQEKVILLGSSFSAGPWAEASCSAASPLFQNLVRSIIESDGSMLPDAVTSVAVVQTPIRIASGLHALPSLVNRNIQKIPVQIHKIDGATTLPVRFTELRAAVPLADPSKPRLTIELRTLPMGQATSPPNSWRHR